MIASVKREHGGKTPCTRSEENHPRSRKVEGMVFLTAPVHGIWRFMTRYDNCIRGSLEAAVNPPTLFQGSSLSKVLS